MTLTDKQELRAVSMEQFEQELLQYFNDVDSRYTSKLLALAQDIRTGKVEERELKRYKAASLEFIRQRLESVDKDIQDAFVAFLLQSELIEESQEVRATLHGFIRRRLRSSLDRLAASAITAIGRSTRGPTSQMLSEVFGKVKEEYERQPTWTLVGVLATCVGRVPDQAYKLADLIHDIGRLDDGGQAFESAVKSRNAIWQAMTPQTSAVDIINAVRRKSARTAKDYPVPSDFDTLVGRGIGKVQGRIHPPH